MDLKTAQPIVRVLLAVEESDYGRPARGPSFAVQSFVEPLASMGHNVEVFDTFGQAWAGDPSATGAALLKRAKSFEPDLVLCMLMNDEIPADWLFRLRGQTVTANWFADDVWRLRTYSLRVAPAFDWAITTWRAAERAYREAGVQSVYLPWGFNPALFHPDDREQTRAVLFVGQRHGRRAQYIARLRAEGYEVETQGTGWPAGRAKPEELAGLYSSSKINLNFVETSGGHLLARGIRFKGSGRLDSLLGRAVGYPRQLKARAFEIPACAGFMLTDSVPELEECFVPGREIGIAQSYRELRNAIEYWLMHDEERRAVAAAGAARAKRDHSYQKRFQDLFATIGLE